MKAAAASPPRLATNRQAESRRSACHDFDIRLGHNYPMVNSTRCSITLALALACGFAGAFAAVPQTRANAFPKIANWNSLVITHEHLGCFGSCPTYRLEIHGDGTVLYNGKAFVTVLGERRGKISADTVRGLFLRFRAAEFFALNDRYSADTDCDSTATSIAFDGHAKSVENQCRASRVVSRLEGEIDRAANIETWIKKPSPPSK
jgi:hypothetical protein